jgi:putative Ca2+/H+ antiporter (TMEM165/GDT1 family)
MMLSAAGVAVLLGLLIVFLIKARALRVSGAILCIIFGLVIGLTAIADPVGYVLTVSGSWLWRQVTRL